MARKTATALKEAQPDLLGGAAPAPKVAVSKIEPKAKASKEVALTVVKPNATNTLSVIAEALKDPQFKPENMRLVLDMHKEMVAEQARLDFTRSMRDLKRDLPIINKDGKIEFKDKGHGKATLRFASFENIHEIINPLLDKYGFELWFSSEPGAAGMINVVGNLEHVDGHHRRTVFPMPHDTSGGKSGAQGWASAFSFGKRIATIGLLNIRTRAPEDRDRDGSDPKHAGKKGAAPTEIEGDVIDNGPPRITTAQHDKLVEALEDAGIPRARFCEVYKVDKVADLPPDMFATAMKACVDYKADKAKKAASRG